MVALVLGLAFPAVGASFQISPIRLALSEAERVATLTIRNVEQQPVLIEVTARRWRQSGGRDRFLPATGMIVTPPIFQVAPERQQIVRVGFPDPVEVGPAELAYRLFLRTLPLAGKAGAPPSGVRVQMAVSVPVFVTRAAFQGAPAGAAWFGEDGALGLRLRNDGRAHIQVVGVARLMDGGTPGRLLPLSRYILANGFINQTLDPSLPAQTMRLFYRSAGSSTVAHIDIPVKNAPAVFVSGH